MQPTAEFKDKFLTRLAEKSCITRRRLDELVKQFGFTYIQANTLFVHHRGYKHFGSDLLRAYEMNPTRAPVVPELKSDGCASEKQIS